MFKQILKTCALAGGLAIATAASLSTPATAHDVREFESDLYFGAGSKDGYSHHFDDRANQRWNVPKRRIPGRSLCTPREALYKAENRFGFRHAHVRRVTRNKIVVIGRKRGEIRKVVFDKRPNRCSVRNFR